MTKKLDATRLRLNLAAWASESTSPNAGAGTAAAIGSMWQRAGSFPGTPVEQYMKIGAADTGWVRQNLVNVQIFNVRDFGATGDGVTNDLAAINAAVSAAAVSGGAVYFPATPNYYRVVAAAAGTDLIPMSNVHNVTLFGDGYASKIKQEGSALGGSTHLLGILNQSSSIRIYNMYFDVANPTNTNEQTHCIQIYGKSALSAPGPQDIEITNCYFGRAVGDGIRLLGELTKEVDNLRISYCAFNMKEGNATGSRAAVSAQRYTRRVMVHHCWVTGSHDQQIDFEPTGVLAPNEGGPEEWSIVGNLLDHENSLSDCITLSGVGEDPTLNTKRCVCAYNQVQRGGDIQGVKVAKLDVIGNIVLMTATNTLAVMEFYEHSYDLVIASNILMSQSNPTSTPFTRTCLTTVFQNADSGRYWNVSNNIMQTVSGPDAVGGAVAFSTQDCSHSTFSGNLCTIDNQISTSIVCVFNATSTNVSNTVLVGNMSFIIGTAGRAGYGFGDNGGIQSDWIARHNWISGGVTQGFRVTSVTDWRGISQNIGVGVTSQMISSLQAIAEGNAGPGQQMVVTQLTNGPETAVNAPVGSVALNNTGQNNVFFYKESGAGVGGGSAGWVRYGASDIAMGAASGSAATAARFFAPGGMDLAAESTVEIQWTATRAGTIRNLRLHCTAGTGGNLNTYTVRKNGVNTTLTFTINNATGSGSDTTHSFTVAAGDLISIQVTKDVAPTTPQTNIILAVEFL